MGVKPVPAANITRCVHSLSCDDVKLPSWSLTEMVSPRQKRKASKITRKSLRHNGKYSYMKNTKLNFSLTVLSSTKYAYKIPNNFKAGSFILNPQYLSVFFIYCGTVP